MKNIIILSDYYKERLFEDTGNLLAFIQNPPPLDKLWGNNASLKKPIFLAKLNEVEFSSAGPNNGSLVIHFKDKTIPGEALFSKKTLSQFNLTNTDPENGITAKLRLLKKDSPHTTVKEALTLITEENNRKTNTLQINNTIGISKENMDEKAYSTFFDVLKQLFLFEAEAPSSLTSTTLFSLAFLVRKELNILPCSFTKTLKESQLSDFDIPKELLAYTALFNKVEKAFAGRPKTEITNLVDKLIQCKASNEESNKDIRKIAYFCSKAAYHEKQGSQHAFGGHYLYPLAQQYHQLFKRFKKPYLEIVQIIDELSVYTASLSPSLRETTESLVSQLRQVTDDYFCSFLETLSHNTSTKNAFERFKLETEVIFKNYKKDNPLEVKSMNLLEKLLNAIARLVPGFILPAQTRINFFKKAHNPHYLFQETVQSLAFPRR